ncbi:MAG: sialate O-acetylesterase [Clostridia bacterium]|nr:sialate O-acetylesterase [Clostridia bacterium]
MIHSILIIGQSNMAGRGIIAEAKPINNKDGRLKVLRNGRWQRMFRPVNPDRVFSGTCLAESFAREYADQHGVVTGIIPCADGGTSLDQWRVGGLLFDNAVMCARLAMRTSNLVAILWHQGEADCAPELNATYLERITVIMRALRSALGAEDIPLLVGGLGDFLENRTESPALANYREVNAALQKFAESSPRTAFVSAEGLTSNPDNLHFNAASLYEFGLRYYREFSRLEDKTRVFVELPDMDDATRTDMEEL